MDSRCKVNIIGLVCCICLIHLGASAMRAYPTETPPVEAQSFSRASLSWELINWQYFCEDEVTGPVVPRSTSERRMRSMCITNVCHALTTKGYTIKAYDPPEPNHDHPGLFYQSADYYYSADDTRYDIQYVTSKDVQLGGQIGLMDLTRFFGNSPIPIMKVQYEKGPGNICFLEQRHEAMNLATLGRISFSRDNVAVQVRKYGGGGDLLAFVRLLDAEILAAASPPPESKQSPESVDWSWGNFCQQHIQGEVKFPVRSKWILRATPSTNTFYAATTNRNVSGYHPNHYLRSYTLTDYLPPQRCKVPGLTCQRLTFSTNRKARPRMENFYEDLRKPPDPGGRGDSFSIEWTTSNDPVNGGRQGLVYLAKDYCKSWERTLEQTAEGPGDLCLIDVVNKKGGNNPSSTLFFCRDNIAVRVHSWQYMDIEDARLIDECLLASPILRTVRSP